MDELILTGWRILDPGSWMMDERLSVSKMIQENNSLS